MYFIKKPSTWRIVHFCNKRSEFSEKQNKSVFPTSTMTYHLEFPLSPSILYILLPCFTCNCEILFTKILPIIAQFFYWNNWCTDVVNGVSQIKRFYFQSYYLFHRFHWMFTQERLKPIWLLDQLRLELQL